ncbi:hypothetical protein AB0D11_02660 [Streptomyces monashensis]|uniref:hypothetical protein n=1 Tax=Streptomyces monashensis TaxID=1678012 RepID=UPI0033EC6223
MANTQNIGAYTTEVYSGNGAVNFQFGTDESMATDAEMAALVTAIEALPWPAGFGTITVQAFKQLTTVVTTNYDPKATPPAYD